MATAATGALTVSLAELVRRLADEFGDLIKLTATATGTTTTLIDTQRITTASDGPPMQTVAVLEIAKSILIAKSVTDIKQIAPEGDRSIVQARAPSIARKVDSGRDA